MASNRADKKNGRRGKAAICSKYWLLHLYDSGIL